MSSTLQLKEETLTLYPGPYSRFVELRPRLIREESIILNVTLESTIPDQNEDELHAL